MRPLRRLIRRTVGRGDLLFVAIIFTICELTVVKNESLRKDKRTFCYNSHMRRKLAVIALMLSVLVLTIVFTQKALSPSLETPLSSDVGETKPASEFDKGKYSLTDPSSLWVIVNKQNSIPTSYVPSDLIVPNVRLRLGSSNEQMKFSKQAEADLKAMFAAAKSDGVNLVFGSGYRSATLQSQFYNSYVAQDGRVAADTYSARPGHSEHQTGLGVDITSPNGNCHLEICWEDTPEGKWVAKNSYKYGFTIRYQKGKEPTTGYQYEPWHLRYVGKSLSLEVKNNQTLEEFFGLPAAPNY